jgi:hypothetical protein
MALVSGGGQTAPLNTALAAPLVAKISDVHGYGVAGVTVHFTDNGAGGTFVASSLATNSTGMVSAQYTTGTKAGKITITASSTGLKNLAIAATAVAGPAANIAITSGNNQAAKNGTKLPKALTVLVTDHYANPVAGVSVSFSDGGAGGVFSNANPGVTSTAGTVSQSYTLPAVPNETISITATAAAVSSRAVFTETGH